MPGPWAGTVTNTEEFLQDRWDKNWRLIAELMVMEREGRYGMLRSRMESIIGFLVYFSRTYKDITPYLKGVHLTLESWRPYRDEEGWRLQVESLKMAEVEGEWGQDIGGRQTHTGDCSSPDEI